MKVAGGDLAELGASRDGFTSTKGGSIQRSRSPPELRDRESEIVLKIR